MTGLDTRILRVKLRSMRNISIKDIHIGAVDVCAILQNQGHQAFIVGGCTRDLLLGLTPKDWDITTDASPKQVMQLFPKTIPTGLQHGTVTVCWGEGVENHFEVTTFRVEGEYKDGRRPEEVTFVKNVEEDLARRDLTINAIAYDPIHRRIVDPFEGEKDLRMGIIRAVGDPLIRFHEDGLRIMRVARFAARFRYDVDRDTQDGMRNSLETLKKVSKERLNDELCKILMTKDAFRGLELLKSCGALHIVCPFLMSEPILTTFLHEQNLCQGDLETRVAFLYANCKEMKKVQQELMELKFSNKSIKKIVFLLQLLDELTTLEEVRASKAYTTFMALIKNNEPEWAHTLEQFLQLTEPMGNGVRKMLDNYRKVIVHARRDMKINGDDLLNMGIKPGPQIKTILDACYAEILEHPEHNEELFLLSFAMGSWKVNKSSIN